MYLEGVELPIPGSSPLRPVPVADAVDPLAVLAATLGDEPAARRFGVVVVAAVGLLVSHADGGLFGDLDLGSVVVDGCEQGVAGFHKSSCFPSSRTHPAPTRCACTRSTHAMNSSRVIVFFARLHTLQHGTQLSGSYPLELSIRSIPTTAIVKPCRDRTSR